MHTYLSEGRSICRSLHLAAFAFLGVAAAPLMANAAASPDPIALRVERDAAVSSLFAPRERGFLGADGAASVQLSPTRIMWIFGDTVLGVQKAGKRQGSMVRNSIALVDRSTTGGPPAVSYYWRLVDRMPVDAFPPEPLSAPYWYWPGTATMSNGRLYVFLTKLENAPGEAGFSFKTIGCVLWRIDNPLDHPDQWKMTTTDLGFGNDHFNINGGILIENGYAYLLGYDDGPTQKGTDRSSILARLPVAQLDSKAPGKAIEFWSESGSWSKSPQKPARLFSPGPTETSLHYIPALKRYLSFSIIPFQPDVLLFSAEKLTGPWTRQTIYRVPEMAGKKLNHAYAVRAHPELSTNPKELLVTYVVNTSDFWSMFNDMTIYFPQFIRLQFP